ncbi:hypothetical protein [Taylorella equigenitalis]|uniref:hypothetical protein n=1 Tax=Taylorella equigenitalis TaxID=29575 RepID=UPI000427BB26|nr:hypothetical protein [Taylorella equigenitalis]WDU51311.1 hypothetical protein KNO32_04845 [Taylorella equigenitalis]WDU52872.1 hypothetical protein KNO31_04785 [Taylorella equigenitalis]
MNNIKVDIDKINFIRDEILNASKVPTDISPELIISNLKNGVRNFDYEVNNSIIKYKVNYDEFKMTRFLVALVSNNATPFIEKNDSENFNQMINGLFSFILNIKTLKHDQQKYGGSIVDILFIIIFCNLCLSKDQFTEIVDISLKIYKEKLSTFVSIKNESRLVFELISLLLCINNSEFSLSEADFIDKVDDEYPSVYRKKFEITCEVGENQFVEHISELCDFRLSLVETNISNQSYNPIWNYFPIDIIYLITRRMSCNLDIPTRIHPYIDDFIPYLKCIFEISSENKLIYSNLN